MQHMRFPLIHTKYNIAFNEYIFYLTNFWYLGIVGVVVIAKKGDETFAFSLDLFTWIRNGDNKHTAIVRCIYESLMKSHASFDSYKESMGYITDVSRLSCNSFAEHGCQTIILRLNCAFYELLFRQQSGCV